MFLKEDFSHDWFEEKLKYNLWCPLQAKGKLGVGGEGRGLGCCLAVLGAGGELNHCTVS